MTYIPKSYSDLEKYILNQQIEKTIELANEKLNDVVLQCFKDHMDSDFYNKYSSKIYPRSYQVREKIGVKLKPIRNGNSVTFGVYFDSSKLETSYWENKGYSGQRYSENGYKPESVMQDILLGKFDNYRDKDIVEMVKSDVEMINIIKKELVNMFLKNGFTVK